jgi:hypothetical protein
MSDQGPYEQLGVSEEASFDEIQAARNRLIEQCGADRQEVDKVEAAYDAVLMHRLRMRQEGKIKVPDRIRFAEQAAPTSPASKISPLPLPSSLPGWMDGLVNPPSSEEMLWPSVVFGGLGGIVLLSSLSEALLQLILLVAVGTTIYFLRRKDTPLGRSVLLVFLGVVLGLMAGFTLALILQQGLQGVQINEIQVATFATLACLWGTCSFLR